MEKKYSILEIIIFILTLVGFLGGILVPIIVSMNTKYWGNIINHIALFNLFLIFAFFCIVTIFLYNIKYRSKEKNRLSQFSIKIAYVGLLINGFWIITGLPGFLY
jgi:hypothetical protein